MIAAYTASGLGPEAQSHVRLWRLPGLGGLELMRARYDGHAFARHGHETFAIGALYSGAEEIWFRDGVERVRSGGLVFIDPEVVHTGTALMGGWGYRVMYPAPAIMAELAATRGTPRFHTRISYDPRAARLLLRAHEAAETEDVLTGETMVRLALDRLLRTFGTATAGRPLRRSGRAYVAQAREILQERLIDPPGLDELARQLGVGPFTLVRSFREAYGLPPHAFLTQTRVRAARRLLRQGRPVAEVAPAVGFFDQAHLSRHFRRIVGMPPGAYRKSGKNVQAPPAAPP